MDQLQLYSQLLAHTDKISSRRGCWLWRGRVGRRRRTKKREYGYCRDILVHRLSWVLHRDGIPEGMTIDHECRRKTCVNPAHLRVMTNRANTLLGNNMAARHARKVRCTRGHDLSIARVSGKGARVCRKCDARRSREYRRNHPEATSNQAEWVRKQRREQKREAR